MSSQLVPTKSLHLEVHAALLPGLSGGLHRERYRDNVQTVVDERESNKTGLYCFVVSTDRYQRIHAGSIPVLYT